MSLVPIKNFSIYKISKDGKLLNTKSGKYLKGSISSQGYKQFSLKNDEGVVKCVLLHRVLAQHFLENPDNHPVVNHKDGNKLNNSLDNLEWVSYKENHDHAIETGLQIKTRGVTCITTGEHYSSAKEASLTLGISRPNISNCCAGRRNSAGKLNKQPLVWRYTDEL